MNQFTASLWGDEGFSAILSMKSIPEILSIIARDTSPPLYNLTEHLAFKLFGTSEIVIRGLSFFYYLIAIFFVYKIASHYWNKRTALICAVLAFLNPFFFIYAFEGRMYSILAMGVTASMYFFITRKWVGHIIFTLIALYSHHFAIFALFIQGLWALKMLLIKRERKEAIAAIKSYIVIGILYAPWLMPLYNQTKMVSGGFWLGTPTITDLRNLIYKFLAEGINHEYSKWALYLSLIILLLRKWHTKFRASVFLLLWFLGPILLTWAVSLKFTSIFYDRYMLYCIPAAMLLLGSGRRKFSLILIAILAVLFVRIDYHYFTHPTKRPFRELATYVKEQKKGDDFLINWNSAAHHLWETKYYGIPAPIYSQNKDALPFFVGTALMTDSDFVSSIPKNARRVIAITSGEVDEITVPGYTKANIQVFGDLKAVFLERTLAR